MIDNFGKEASAGDIVTWSSGGRLGIGKVSRIYMGPQNGQQVEKMTIEIYDFCRTSNAVITGDFIILSDYAPAVAHLREEGFLK